jgi:hypothetical protein
MPLRRVRPRPEVVGTASRRKTGASVGELLLALAFVLLSTCAGQDGAVRTNTLPLCAPQCRILPDGHPPEHPECMESADCGERAHAVRMMCIAGYVCEPACADHWADCNKDYRDGCETPSEDGRCEGDETIATDPVAAISCMRESSLPGPYDCNHFTSAADDGTSALDKCYQRVLRAQPGAEGTVDFAVTVASDGHVTEIVFLASESSNAALQACARSAISDLLVRSGTSAQIAATYPVRAVFVAGSDN